MQKKHGTRIKAHSTLTGVEDGEDVAGDFVVRAPDSLGDKDFVSFFRGWTWYNDPPERVVLDFSTADFTAPWAAAMFGAYGRWLRDVRGKSLDLRLDDGTTAGQFLLRAGLPQLLGLPAVSDLSASPDRLVPLTQVHSSSDIQPCVSVVMNILALDDQEMADAIRYSLVELLRNVVQHARSRIGGVVTAAYFPKAGIVDVVVADMGCGIRAALHERYPEIKDDYKAVKFAIQPHVSGTFQRGAYESMADNAGLGLFFIKEIATLSGGGFFLASGSMLADLWGNYDGSPGKKYFVSKSSGWRGTFALLQLRRNRIEEFSAVLQRCREIAAEVRKDPTELKLDFLDEVPEVEGLITVLVKPFEENVEAAADIRERIILPSLQAGNLVVLDFSSIRAATQSFIHALMYRVFRDGPNVEVVLSVASADPATQEAIRAVAAYARVRTG